MIYRSLLAYLFLTSSLTLCAEQLDTFQLPWMWETEEEAQDLFHECIVSTSYTKPSQVEHSVWDTLAPYLLPENHPIKEKLDKLFSSRITESVETITAAGFLRPNPGRFSHTIVSKHPQLKGYYLKFFVDTQTDIVDWVALHKRLVGAQLTRESIERHGYQIYFKVPQKWIYPLPENPAPAPSNNPKRFILIAEDMNILTRSQNHKQWASAAILSPKRLKAYYTIMQEVGLNDSNHVFNVPFCRDGKQTFLDTERYHRWPINFSNLNRYIAKSLRPYWQELISSDGKGNKTKKTKKGKPIKWL
ncbi:MAG: hypothetical protein H0X51_04795 [Parachlamydiaceae bacterium]|nr:hypothetical protein [Parachlamydiaceae bacterium]